MSKRCAEVGRRGWVLLVALVLSGCALLAPNQAGRVYAQASHAVLVHSEPAEGSVLVAPPVVVQLWFTEPVQLASEGSTS